MDSPEPATRLCIFCRRVEKAYEPCPRLQHRQGNTQIPQLAEASGLTSDDYQLIRTLQQQTSPLCNRCSAYNPPNVFRHANPLDGLQQPVEDKIKWPLYCAEMAHYRLQLGRPSSIHLSPSCPFCRLLYCILARTQDAESLDFHIEPYRAHIRYWGWEVIPDADRRKFAIFLGLATNENLLTAVSSPFRPQDDNVRMPGMGGPAIAMTTDSLQGEMRWMNARPLGSKIDFAMLRKPLDWCLKNHGDYCGAPHPSELTECKMIDVEARKVVQCPPDCDYIILSYVWGGVQPAPGALENKCLPQTIEDAITVTIALGRRYLWVDALCIDQSPNPTPEQWKEKQRQLGMMATIYGCATATIIGLTAKNSNQGLAGVSVPRLHQLKEEIDGCTLFTLPRDRALEEETAEWSRRAWTLQEAMLSRRQFNFGEGEVEFSCLRSRIAEGTDPSSAYGGDLNHPVQNMHHLYVRPESGSVDGANEARMHIYVGTVENYTSRRMTNESDSLNAFLGLLTAFQRQLFPQGFVHGLPLHSHPSSLFWIHDRSITPKRRAAFPSWSWCGWEGTIRYPQPLIETFDGQLEDEIDIDFKLNLLGSTGNEITLSGWTVDLDIRTEPFSEVFVPGTEDSIASVMEGNKLHNNTLETGKYSCLVVQRNLAKDSSRTAQRQRIFLIVLDWKGEVAERRTALTMTPFAGHDFTETMPQKRFVRLV